MTREEAVLHIASRIDKADAERWDRITFWTAAVRAIGYETPDGRVEKAHRGGESSASILLYTQPLREHIAR